MTRRDAAKLEPLIQGIVILFAVIFTGVNLIVDLAYAALNPRLRHA